MYELYYLNLLTLDKNARTKKVYDVLNVCLLLFKIVYDLSLDNYRTN